MTEEGWVEEQQAGLDVSAALLRFLQQAASPLSMLLSFPEATLQLLTFYSVDSSGTARLFGFFVRPYYYHLLSL